MPRSVFLDTSGWIALLNAREELHATAVRRWRELGREGCRLVLTEWVLAETGNGLARTPARIPFAKAARQVLISPNVQVVPVTTSLVRRALDLYASRSDKSWGLVDCASFVIMADQGIAEAFTTDRHFEQAGFTCLLPLTLGE
jgi:hypothetical protein